MSDWKPNGRHRYRIEGDTMFVEVNGPTDADELLNSFAVSTPIAEQYGYVLSVTDARLGGSLTPAARKAHAQWARDNPKRLTANIIFGAPRAPGVLINLIAHALRASIGFDMGLHFAKDEAEALALVVRERARLVSKIEQTRQTGVRDG